MYSPAIGTKDGHYCGALASLPNQKITPPHHPNASFGPFSRAHLLQRHIQVA